MQKVKKYIEVILPLKIKWEMCYFTFLEGLGIGDWVMAPVGTKTYPAVVSKIDAVPNVAPSKIREVGERLEFMPPVSEAEIQFWVKMAQYYMCEVGEVMKAAYPSSQIILSDPSQKRKTRKKSVDASFEQMLTIALSKRPELSESQLEAYKKIQSSSRSSVLLDGVTGSGKTEIYICCALDELAKGKNVLYLVPEIAMSRQLELRLKKVFGQLLLVSHSGETPARRRQVASALRTGPYVVLGTRSSIFLPHRNLGLVVVDEENDSSYKQDNPSPRYNGRDMALLLGSLSGAKVLLGSATPSLESICNCQQGRYDYVALKQRYYNSSRTNVEIIDTVAERKKRGMRGTFSLKLIAMINETLAGGGQVMILRNRRGYSPVMQCPECGFMPKCPKCNLSLSYHKDSGVLKCHHCGNRLTLMTISTAQGETHFACPKCGGALCGLGAGTQKIEEEAAALFPNARIARLDSDSDGALLESQVIDDFENGKVDILIGTQMLAKGFDFSNLSLVAVLQADTLLGIQDFRADEKALQLLTQFMGRCGRRDKAGTLVIQTRQVAHPVYVQFLNGGCNESGENFVAGLLEERKMFGYPPYSRIVNVVLHDVVEQRLDNMAEILAQSLKNVAEKVEGMKVASPSRSQSKDNNGYSSTIRINLAKDRLLAQNKQLIIKTVTAFEGYSDYSGHIHFDVDPL